MTDNPGRIGKGADRTDDMDGDMDSGGQNATQATTADPVLEEKPARPRWARMALMWGVPLLLAAIGGYFWLTSGRYASTDNAYVQQDMVQVTSEVGGPIVEVTVAENDYVKKGDLLFRIDPEPYELALNEANASIASAQVNIGTLQSSYNASTVDISAAREDIGFAQATFQRQQALLDRGFTTKADYDAAKHAVEQARESYRQAQADATAAKARLSSGTTTGGTNPDLAAAQVKREQALLNLKRTEVRAPFAGRVTQADRLQTGQMMVAGLPALTLVADRKSWIEANFKETQLARMEPGQPVEIEFDSFPDLKLRGHVESIGAGTGSEFSVLPAQNATGNWVKVTQRVPVRIAIDEKSPRQLIAGQSADVSIDLNAE